MGRPQRVLVTPREIAGVAAGLQEVLTRRGHRVDVLLRWAHPFSYRHTPIGWRLLRVLAPAIVEPENARAPRIRRLISLLLRALLVPLVAVRYDAVVFVGPDTLLRGGLDRRLLRRLGVRTVTVFCGSEARPPYLDGWYAAAGATATLDDARAAVVATSDRVRLAERDSTYVVNHAGGSHFHREPFLDWTVVGFAQRSPDGPAAGDGSAAGAPLRVLHAPSDRRMKGTDAIRSAVETLRAEGMQFDYVEVSGRSHAEVEELVRGADIVVDQLYSDALLPGLASEAARAGTAVIVCGYAADLIADAARRTGAPTDHYAAPDEFLAQLRRLLMDGGARAQLVAALHAFVTTGHWAPDAIGARWERILAGTPDPGWFDAPAGIVYPHGCAASRADISAFLRAYLDRFGVDALELGHHPALAAAVVAQAAG